MNWLLYISGWFFGWVGVNTIFVTDKGKYKDFATLVKLVCWTAMWVWFCWKFIK